MFLLKTRTIQLLVSSVCIASALVVSPVRAQWLGNSPYSALGIGDVYFQGNVINQAMGGVGISNASPFYLNMQNPALLGSRPPYTTFEVGLTGQVKSLSQQMSSGLASQRSFGGNLGYLALAFPASPRWSISLNLRPYTYVGYNTQQYNQFPNSIYQVQANYSGKGGLNKASVATGYRVWKNVYVGAEGSFLYGNIITGSDAQLSTGTVQYGSRISRIDRVNYSDIVWRLGAAWKPKLTKDWTLGIGATYDPEMRVKATQTEIYQHLSQTGAGLAAPDTIQNNSTGQMTLPQYVQGGISMEKNNKLMVAVDGGWQQWNRFSGQDGKRANFRNTLHAAVGAEFTPKPNSTRYRDLITYRAGLRYAEMPYAIAGQPIQDVSLSGGISLPVGAYFVNHATLSLSYGQRGVLAGYQLREQYVRIGLGFSLTDRWFRKTVID